MKRCWVFLVYLCMPAIDIGDCRYGVGWLSLSWGLALILVVAVRTEVPGARAKLRHSLSVSFQQKNLHFPLANPDFLLQNDDFRLKNDDFRLKNDDFLKDWRFDVGAVVGLGGMVLCVCVYK